MSPHTHDPAELHHLSTNFTAQLAGLIDASFAMLRCEDAYHTALLMHERHSPQVAALTQDRLGARLRFRELLDEVRDHYDDI